MSLRWAERTWTELRDAIADRRLVVLLPVGATEAHGPHLAVDADVVIAEEVALRAARALEVAGRPALVLPPVSYTVTRFALAFPGTIGLGPVAARATLADIAVALAAQGVQTLAIVNHHLEPAHVEILHTLAAAPPRGMNIVFPDHTRKPHSLALGDEFRKGDCHAGSYETSIVLAAQAGRVRDEVRRGLEARWLGLVAGIKEGKRTFAEIGMKDAYVGDPAAATAAEGEKLLDALAKIVLEAIRHAGA